MVDPRSNRLHTNALLYGERDHRGEFDWREDRDRGRNYDRDQATDLAIEIPTGNETLTGTVIEGHTETKIDIGIENENQSIVRKIAVMWDPGGALLSETVDMMETGIETIPRIGRTVVVETGAADAILLFVVGERMKAGRE